MSHSPSGAPQKRLMVINPNTNAVITERIRTMAESTVSPGVTVDVANPRSGPMSIETADDRLVAEPHAIDMIRTATDQGVNAFVLACFDDIAVAAGRRIASGPVLDACEASIFAARSIAHHFAIVTTFESAIERIEQLVRRFGAEDACSVSAAGIGVAAAASDTGAAPLHNAIARSLRDSNAEAIILGSGGYAGQSEGLSQEFGVPIIDGVRVAIALCDAILRTGTCWSNHKSA
jgi:allantoin racemase